MWYGFGFSRRCGSWLKMALPYPSSAPFLSSVRWRLWSSCYCSNAWLIYHPWPERGATERTLIPFCALCSRPTEFQVYFLRPNCMTLLDLTQLFCFGWSDLIKLIYCQSHIIYRNYTSMWRPKRLMGFKNFFSLSVTIHYSAGKCDRNDWGYLVFARHIFHR